MADKEFLSAKEAAEYLRKRWGLNHFSVNSFRQYRYRRKIKSSFGLPNSSVWTKAELDAMVPPDDTKRRDQGSKDSLNVDTMRNAVLSYV